MSLRGASVLALLGVLAQGGFRVMVNIAIGRFAGAVVLGQSAGILAAAQFLTLLGPTSIASAQTRFLAASVTMPGAGTGKGRGGVAQHARKRTLQVTLAVMFLGAGTWGLILDSNRQHVVTLLVLTAGLVAYGLAKSHRLAIRSMRRLAAAEAVTALGGLIGLLIMLQLGVRDVRLLWSVAGTAFACAVLTWVREVPGDIGRSKRREIDAFAALGVMGTLVSAGFMQGSVLIASEGIGGEAAGHYAAAFALATPLSLVTTSIGMVLFPAFSGALSDAARTRHLLARALGAMGLILVPTFSAIMFLAPEVVTIVWGAEFAPSAQILPILALAILFMGVGMPASQALTSTGIQGMKQSVRIGLLGTAAGVGVWVSMVPTSGVLGVGLGFAVGASLHSSLPLILVARRLDVAWYLYFLRGWIVPTGVATASVMLIGRDADLTPRIVALAICLVTWGLTIVPELRGTRSAAAG